MLCDNPFLESTFEAPSTEGIKYTGSKLKLLPHIIGLVAKTGARTVLDGFSGSTRVSQALAKLGYEVISNDISVWSKVLGTCYLLNEASREKYVRLIHELNATSPKDGWFTEHYGGYENNGNAVQQDGFKKPWQIHNTRKLDGIRDRIDLLDLSPIERAVALTSLILALDKVDSTLGHYVSYLKSWAPRSYSKLWLEVPRVFVSRGTHQVTQNDIFAMMDYEVDLAYYDPPYGSSNDKMPASRVRYASYYHTWTTICLNDRPDTFGKAMRRRDSSDKLPGSMFEDFRKNPITGQFVAVDALERLLRMTKSRWILLSYGTSGRGTLHELMDMIGRNGETVDIRRVDYRRNVMSSMKWTHEWVDEEPRDNQEFLFLIYKG